MTPVHHEPGPARPPSLGRSLEKRGKRWATRALGWLLHPRPLTDEQLARLPVRTLLIIRQHNQMGDMVLCLPALRALRQRWPQARLRFVTAPLCRELLQDHPDIDELLVFDKRRLRRPDRGLAWLRHLRQPAPDLTVVLGSVSFSTTSALLALVSGAPVRVGASSLPFGSALSQAVYHRELSAPAGEHEVERNLSTLRALHIAAPAAFPHLQATAQDRATAAQFLGATEDAAASTASARPTPARWVMLHVGAGKRPNVWPPECFAALIDALAEDGRLGFVLTEGPRDATYVDAVVQQTHASVRRWQKPLPETLGLLQHASLVVSNDTGMAHVAAALARPTLVLFGPTDPTRWRPAGPRVTVLRPASQRIIDLPVGDVVEAARRLLLDAPTSALR